MASREPEAAVSEDEAFDLILLRFQGVPGVNRISVGSADHFPKMFVVVDDEDAFKAVYDIEQAFFAEHDSVPVDLYVHVVDPAELLPPAEAIKHDPSIIWWRV